MYKLFYELIRVAIGTSSGLSHMPSSDEWQLLYKMSVKQALLGICLNGIQTINERNQALTEKLSKKFLLQWIGEVIQLQERNKLLNRQCVEVQRMFKESGLNTCILKGQGVANYYNPNLILSRQSGDIDIWVDSTWRDVMDFVNARTPNREFDMKHTHFELYPDTTVEVHWWPSMPKNPFFRKALQKYYNEQSLIQCKHMVTLKDGNVIYAPDAKFEAVHVLYHIFNHFLYEGIGLRQMLDLYFVLVNGEMTDEDRKEVEHIYKRVGLSSFAPAAMWVLCEVFGMDEKYCIGKKDEAFGRTLIREVEEGGNFGYYSADNRVYNESFAHRMKRRLMRRIRLMRYNPWGVITSPFTKVRILLWKRKVIKMYKL